jgi:hypothetical protein
VFVLGGAACTATSIERDDEMEQRASALYLANAQTWASNGNYIPICWHNADGSGLFPEREIAQNAVDRTWGANSDLQLDWRGTCPTTDEQGRFLMFGITQSTTENMGITPDLGMANFSWPSSNYPGPRIWFKTDVSLGRLEYLAVHEFGHALGFRHEQERPESEAADCRGTDSGVQSGVALTPYDSDSIMNYCNSSGNSAGGITQYDKDGIAKVYGYHRARSFEGDFDGDHKTDIAVWRPSDHTWYIIKSNGGSLIVPHGDLGDIPVPADYDGDGTTDIAVWRPSNHTWYVIKSSGGSLTVAHGDPGDIPVPGRYDNDNKADIAVWRPRNHTWYVINSAGGSSTTAHGDPGDIPVPADYDGDGKTDLAVWRPSNHTWYIIKSAGGSSTIAHGDPGDIPVPGRYDSDNKADVAVWRPSDHNWYIIKSTGGWIVTPHGDPGDAPVPGDYDGDGKTDLAVWRPSNHTWYIIKSTGGSTTVAHGNTGDIAIPR